MISRPGGWIASSRPTTSKSGKAKCPVEPVPPEYHAGCLVHTGLMSTHKGWLEFGSGLRGRPPGPRWASLQRFVLRIPYSVQSLRNTEYESCQPGREVFCRYRYAIARGAWTLKKQPPPHDVRAAVEKKCRAYALAASMSCSGVTMGPYFSFNASKPSRWRAYTSKIFSGTLSSLR